MNKVFDKSFGWIIANVLGIIIFLSLEFWLMLPRSEPESLGSFNIIAFWITYNFPLIFIFLVINLTWRYRIKKYYSENFKKMLLPWYMTCFAWAVSLLLNGIAIKLIYIFFGVSFFNKK